MAISRRRRKARLVWDVGRLRPGRQKMNAFRFRQFLRAASLCGAVLTALVLFASAPAAANTSCSAWRATCYQRCTGLGDQCKPNCDRRAAECRRTGCFYAGAEGKKYCGMEKK